MPASCIIFVTQSCGEGRVCESKGASPYPRLSGAMSNSTPAAKPCCSGALTSSREKRLHAAVCLVVLETFFRDADTDRAPSYPSPFGTADQFGLAKVGGL